MPAERLKRWVATPNSGGRLRPGQVTGVSLEKGEDVRWSWTFGQDGSQIVTGYEIISKKKSRVKKRGMWFAPS
jgi:hypothetical protein